ncbi:glycosyltransferase family 2 protein [Patescibacteria group bacterium]|nr:glycosyltransferase family 2 protein [Patescibacteria group bacterium]
MTKKVSIILPCRDEKESIENTIRQIKETFEKNNINGEIIVSDSSKDGSDTIASGLGVTVIKHDKKGYGIALREGFKIANGEIIIFADPDGTYDFSEIPKFLKVIKNADLVIGSRFKGKIMKKAMPWSHRYIGNPVLTFLLNLFFKVRLSDAHSGFRAIRRNKLKQLGLKTTGMEFASEMIIQAIKKNLKIKEIPINYYPRAGSSKLRSFHDGWRHLRFMLLFSPTYLFMVPGLMLFIFGLFIELRLLFGPIDLFGLSFYNHPIIIGSFLMLVGFQIMFTGFFAKIYLFTILGEENRALEKFFKTFNLEKGLMLGALVFLAGLILDLAVLLKWTTSNFGELSEIKLLVFALTMNVLGVQLIFNSFYLSILGIKKNE